MNAINGHRPRAMEPYGRSVLTPALLQFFAAGVRAGALGAGADLGWAVELGMAVNVEGSPIQTQMEIAAEQLRKALRP
jgi:hypothetical protein